MKKGFITSKPKSRDPLQEEIFPIINGAVSHGHSLYPFSNLDMTKIREVLKRTSVNKRMKKGRRTNVRTDKTRI